jgi:translation initiation factor IF-3
LVDNKLNWRINHQIRASELRVIGPDGKQLGVLSMGDALRKAQDLELDLIEIAPTAKPPVAKIMNLGKFKYEQEKKIQKEKKNAKVPDIKEVRFSPFIAEHDFSVKLKRVDEFLNENNKVRLVVNFTNRQLGSKQFGYDLIKKIYTHFSDRVVTDMEPKFLGRNLISVISPTKKKQTSSN